MSAGTGFGSSPADVRLTDWQTIADMQNLRFRKNITIHALLTLPERTDTTVPIPSTAMKAWSKHNVSKPLEKEQREKTCL